MKKIIFLFIASILISIWVSFSQTSAVLANWLELIPKAETDPDTLGTVVECVGWGEGCKKWSVWDRYNEKVKWMKSWDQFATGIFSWDAILKYLWYTVVFISQVGILIGVIMIIVAGYKYATYIFTNKKPNIDDIKNAIIGVVVIVSSFAIMKILQAVTGIW